MKYKLIVVLIACSIMSLCACKETNSIVYEGNVNNKNLYSSNLNDELTYDSNEIDSANDDNDFGNFFVEPIKVGDIIKFGKFEDCPIEWDVLETDGDTAILISHEVLCNEVFNKECVDTNWRDSYIREWLNGTFYDGFTDKEKGRILTVVNNNSCESEYYKQYTEIECKENSNVCGETEDKVYLLSWDEFFLYYNPVISENYKPLAPNATGLKDGHYGNSWWLRSNGLSGKSAMDIECDGILDDISVDIYNGVRPVIKIDVSGLWNEQGIEGKNLIDKKSNQIVRILNSSSLDEIDKIIRETSPGCTSEIQQRFSDGFWGGYMRCYDKNAILDGMPITWVQCEDDSEIITSIMIVIEFPTPEQVERLKNDLIHEYGDTYRDIYSYLGGQGITWYFEKNIPGLESGNESIELMCEYQDGRIESVSISKNVYY